MKSSVLWDSACLLQKQDLWNWHTPRTQKLLWEPCRWGSPQRANGCTGALWTGPRLGLPSGTICRRLWGLQGLEVGGGLNLSVFLPQKRQKEKTPHVDVGAAQQPPVCVYRSACLGVVPCGHGDDVTPSVDVSVRFGVWGVYVCVCSMHSGGRAPRRLSRRALLSISVSKVCDRVLFAPCVWPESGHVLTLVISGGGGGGGVPRRQLCTSLCGPQ